MKLCIHFTFCIEEQELIDNENLSVKKTQDQDIFIALYFILNS